MAYIPTEWETGDIITAEKLNKAEQGIANASDEVFVIKATYSFDGGVPSATLDRTLSEILSAVDAGKPLVMNEQFTFIQPDYEDNEPVGVTIGQKGTNLSTGEFHMVVMKFVVVDGVLTWTPTQPA